MFNMFDEKTLIFQKQDGGKLKITNNVLEQFRLFRQIEQGEHEAGGLLLGRYIINSNDTIIDLISTPQLNDVSSPVKFIKNKDEHQAIVDEAWEKSCGTCNFLGEWHTHPEKIPSPSIIDIKNWKSIISKAVFESNSLYFLIIGSSQISAFEVTKSNRNIIQLQWQRKRQTTEKQFL